jgi:hypothetical protein
MPSPNSSPEEHIARIRKTKFGLAPDGSLVEQNPLSDDLQRAISHLSEGLYTKETHFILELIQNAEDNQYRDNEKPDLAFILLREDPSGTQGTEGALLVVNNELGFRTDNVDALCAVGKTTKHKREGYIGEKGIGFKSVFVVSPRPHIFSGGYRFHFQEDPDPQANLGYIVPYWMSEIYPETAEHSGKTCILLPLKPDRWAQVAQELEAIAPETVLFLSKLDGLTVEIGEQAPIAVIRDDSRAPLVQFLKGEDYVEYWVIHQEFAVPDDLGEEKREGVDTRRVSIALPLTQASTSNARVFAFLPTDVRSGFSFLVNADFILSTSREAIQVDRPWNLWLRDCIAPVFCQAFTSLLEQPEYRPRAYSFIPLDKEVEGKFFKDVVKAICQDLGNRSVVWTFRSDAFVRPSEARLVTESFRELLGTSCIPEQLEKTPLVHPRIQSFGPQLKAIGVADLNTGEIVACLEDEDWLSSQTPEWFAELYTYLSEHGWATRERLSPLRLLPLSSGERTSAVERPVLFPPEDSEETSVFLEQIPASLPVAFLHPRLLERLSGNNELIQWVETTLGVQELTPDTLCLDIARWLAHHYEEITVADLVQLTAYIRDQFEGLDQDTQEELAQLLPVALNDETIIEAQSWSEDQPLVMPETLDPRSGWQVVFPHPEDRSHLHILAEDYLADCSEEAERKVWLCFFEAIGATSAPLPRTQHWRWWRYCPEDIPDHAKDLIAAEREYSTLGYQFRDWRAPQWLRELASIGRGKRGTKKRSRALLKWIQYHLALQSYSRKQVEKAGYWWHYFKWRYKPMRWSEFYYCLLNAPWFPTTQGLKRPGEVFVGRPELRELFGDSVAYAPKDLDERTAKWLGLRMTATIEEVLQYLRQVSSQPAEQADRRAVRKAYSFLSERWQIDLGSQFEEYPLILVSKPQPRWVTAKQAVWPDLSTVFGETHAYLEREYGRQLEDFFVKKVGVPDQVGPELYAQAMIYLAEGDGLAADAIEGALERIYPELLKIARSDEKLLWWQEFCGQAKVWTQSDRFETHDEVFVPDDGALKQIFSGEGVEFAWRPEKASFADYWPLYRALGVRSLIETVEEIPDFGLLADTDDTPLLTLPAKRAICTYLWNMNRSTYERSKQDGLLEALLQTEERTVKSLAVEYRLDWTWIDGEDACAYWEPEECILYRSSARSLDQMKVDIPAILARRLCQGRTSSDLENFIGRVLGVSEATAAGIIRKSNWHLPPEEDEWIGDTLNLASTSPSDETLTETASAEPETTPEDAVRGILGTRESVRTPPEVGPRETPMGYGKRTAGSAKRSRARETERLRTYVIPARTDQPTHGESIPETTSERSKVDQAGIRHVLEYEISKGRTPTEMDHYNEGFDVESRDADEEVRYIEVKSLSGDWDARNAAGLTRTQFEFARDKDEAFWLYVVERATSDNYHIHCIQNPANRVNQYLFDDGWQALAQAS